MKYCMGEVEKTLTGKKEILDRFAKELLEREELEYDEIIAIFAEYGYKENQGDEPAQDQTWNNKA